MAWVSGRGIALQPHTEALIVECFDALLRRAVSENDEARIVMVSKAIVDFSLWRQRLRSQRVNRRRKGR